MTLLFRAAACALLLVPAFAAESQTGAEQIEAHARAAEAALRANQPAKAIPEYAAIVKLDPRNVDARANLGTLLFFAGDYAR
ncbi:MAG TPA: tetratricopeptide repeat protein, partial [Terriglobia bacterium]|nr:tetratricopeptide repeat protein [Terriglobia bacterium]